MVTQDLTSYVKTLRQYNISDDQIANKLKEVGWAPEDISTVLKKPENTSVVIPTQKPSPAQPLSTANIKTTPVKQKPQIESLIKSPSTTNNPPAQKFQTAQTNTQSSPTISANQPSQVPSQPLSNTSPNFQTPNKLDVVKTETPFQKPQPTFKPMQQPVNQPVTRPTTPLENPQPSFKPIQQPIKPPSTKPAPPLTQAIADEPVFSAAEELKKTLQQSQVSSTSVNQGAPAQIKDTLSPTSINNNQQGITVESTKPEGPNTQRVGPNFLNSKDHNDGKSIFIEGYKNEPVFKKKLSDEPLHNLEPSPVIKPKPEPLISEPQVAENTPSYVAPTLQTQPAQPVQPVVAPSQAPLIVPLEQVLDRTNPAPAQEQIMPQSNGTHTIVKANIMLYLLINVLIFLGIFGIYWSGVSFVSNLVAETNNTQKLLFFVPLLAITSFITAWGSATALAYVFEHQGFVSAVNYGLKNTLKFLLISTIMALLVLGSALALLAVMRS